MCAKDNKRHNSSKSTRQPAASPAPRPSSHARFEGAPLGAPSDSNGDAPPVEEYSEEEEEQCVEPAPQNCIRAARAARGSVPRCEPLEEWLPRAPHCQTPRAALAVRLRLRGRRVSLRHWLRHRHGWLSIAGLHRLRHRHGRLAVRHGLLGVRHGLTTVHHGLLGVRHGLLAVCHGLLGTRHGLALHHGLLGVHHLQTVGTPNGYSGAARGTAGTRPLGR